MADFSPLAPYWSGLIERTLFAFIWKYSKRDQIGLLLITLLLFPLLYLTLELPKQIINDAIDAQSDTITAFGFDFGQIEYLLLLCTFFLLAVLAHGLLKMRINTMKGVLAERLLRRFRYTLIARILRFPQPYFERTSQGEIVSMVTSESEPMGGLMGDALAQPVLQAGQMLTILYFLFAQSITFGLAACALIPLQAWIIPKLQWQINKLNKKRVLQVRALAAEIGELSVGASTLRAHGGWRYRLAMATDRLGRLYALRFEIYQKKFFMKFINNFITQLTPFLFYAFGGYLVIQGDVTLGALVAALAAYKDLSSPWKELLAYYNQSADMSLRWDTITDRFAPTGMVDNALMQGDPGPLPTLTGDINLSGVTVRDVDGNPVLDQINTVLPGGKLVGITAASDEDRRAFAELLTREVVPSSGTITIGDMALNTLHQDAVATRVGHATSRPVLFQGSFGDNVFLPLKFRPMGPGKDEAFASEAQRAGNSEDMLSALWLDPVRVGHKDEADVQNRWCTLVERIGGAGALFRRAMDQRLEETTHPELTAKLISLRPRIAAALADAKLERHVYRLDPDAFNPALPVVQNLLFGTPINPLPADALAERLDYLELMRGLGLDKDLMELALTIMEGLRQIFGAGGTDHPLFQKTGLEPELYEAALETASKAQAGTSLDEKQQAVLLSVPSSITALQVGPAFPDRIRDKILSLRKSHGETLRSKMADLFAPISQDAPLIGMTVLENAIFGKLSDEAGPRTEAVRAIVADVLHDEGVSRDVLQLVFEVPITLGGANLPATFAEPLAVSRAVIKSPDILVLDHVMASFDTQTRLDMMQALRRELPNATIVYLAATLEDAMEFDMTIEISQGRLTGTAQSEPVAGDGDVSSDLARKVQALEQTDMFATLDRKQLRLLAFGARWYTAQDGQYVFYKNDAADDGAFMLIEGEADLLLPMPDAEDDKLIVTVGPGALVGELGLIRDEPRALDMRANGELMCLRIGKEEFLAVVENDAATAFKLLQVISGYVKT
ncbi:MAG: ABC transporter transmembrane domain-containing protein [Aliishimia sp.]